jgi:hypothetical protein
MSKWWINGHSYTCRNSRFQTDIVAIHGKPHGPGNAAGSVFDAPLVDNGGYSLWLEYVEDHKYGGNMFWLMWYDAKGVPTIPASGVFDLDQLRSMNSQLAAFIQMPR